MMATIIHWAQLALPVIGWTAVVFGVSGVISLFIARAFKVGG